MLTFRPLKAPHRQFGKTAALRQLHDQMERGMLSITLDADLRIAALNQR